jgi:hypothetical protein
VYGQEVNVYHNLLFVRKYGCTQTSAREYLNGELFGSASNISPPSSGPAQQGDQGTCLSTEEVFGDN